MQIFLARNIISLVLEISHSFYILGSGLVVEVQVKLWDNDYFRITGYEFK
jgi:hypothetical protein